MRLSDWYAPCGDGSPDCPEDAEAAEAAETEPDETPSSVFVVCDCGISRRIAVDEDGLCASCGAFPIMAADLGSAEAASDLIEDCEAAAARAEAAEQRAEAAEARAAQAEADARLMLATVYELGVAFDAALTEDLYDHGCTEDEYAVLDALADEYAAADSAALLAPLRRILATARGA